MKYFHLPKLNVLVLVTLISTYTLEFEKDHDHFHLPTLQVITRVSILYRYVSHATFITNRYFIDRNH